MVAQLLSKGLLLSKLNFASRRTIVRASIFDTCEQECYIALDRAIAERETSLMHTNKKGVMHFESVVGA